MALRFPCKVISAVVLPVLLVACQSASVPSSPVGEAAVTTVGGAPEPLPERLGIDVPMAWGGELRCGTSACRLIAVEHETSHVVLYEVTGRKSRLLDRKAVAYHPDSAIWLSDDVVVAAVEASFSLDVFRVVQNRLQLITQIPVGMSPRDLILIQADEDRFRILATPYSGTEVVWVDFSPSVPDKAVVRKSRWCEAPWHPARVTRAPGSPAGGLVVACLDEQRVLFAPGAEPEGIARNLVTIPGAVRLVPRYTRPSPSGKWLYVAIETGGRNLRLNMDNGELQWIVAPQPVGSVGVMPLSDELIVWAVDSKLYLQRLANDGTVLETRALPTDGFSTGLQLIDADLDAVQDLVVLNSAALPKKMGIEIIYGPLWERAKPHVTP